MPQATQSSSGDSDSGSGPRILFRGSILQATIIVATGLLSAGCDRNESTEAPEPTTGVVTSDATPTGERRGYEIPIPQLEYWDPERRTMKYSYEMRFDAPGSDGRARLHRNGWARAYFGSGVLEREGSYQWIPQRERSERVGTWTYYKPDGTVDRIEQRGGDSIWTGPDQRTSPPGTVSE